MLRVVMELAVVGVAWISMVNSHSESGEWTCQSNSENRAQAEFRPGVVTLDGHADDWEDIDGYRFPLLPALDPHAEHEYKGGRMTIKALHDGRDVFFMLQVDGNYAYSKGANTKCPSVALMFQIGEQASYHNMGGCKEPRNRCTPKTCHDYEVDIMHFSIGKAIPGRLYGGNPVDNGTGGDRFGHLVDGYSWNPHCRYIDGLGPSGNDSRAQNDWKGAWWHSSMAMHSGFVEGDSPYASDGVKGTYYFEFSRPLRTMDVLQQDVQFKIGEPTKFSAAFWYPVNGKPWHGSSHYSVGCGWVPLEILSGPSPPVSERSSCHAASAFSLLLPVAALCISAITGYKVSRSSTNIPFTPAATSMNDF